MGYNAIGMPGNTMKPQFGTLFDGCDVAILPDADKPSWQGAKKTVEILKGHAASIKVARLPTGIESSNGWDARDIIAVSSDGPNNLRRCIKKAEPPEKAFAWMEKKKPLRFVDLITSPELLALDLRPRFLVRDVLVAGHPNRPKNHRTARLRT